MSTGIKIAIITGSILLLAASGVGFLFWRMTTQPMYRPGMVRAGQNLRAPLTPPAAQPNDDAWWVVEEDIRLWHFSQGSGRNVLIVHGGPGYPYRQPWSGLEPLADDFQFHYYDQRGCGRSTRPIDTLTAKNNYQNIQTLEQTLGIGAQLADIERIRQILGEDRLILVGHSFGGFLAALYAAEFPEHVEALVLVSPADVLVMPPTQGGLFEAVRERLPAEMQADYDAYMEEYLSFKGIFDKSEAEMVAFNSEFDTYFTVAFDLPHEEQGEPGGWMVQAQYFSLGQRHDSRDALANVAAPALIVHSTNDLQPQAVGQMYVDALPEAQLAIVENATHAPFEEQPEAFASVVGNFLRCD